MFEPSSRYFALETAYLEETDADGRVGQVAYKRRRFIPLEEHTELLLHRFAQGERLDNLTARYLGDPTQFWRICDANFVLQPEELEEVNRAIRIAMPQL